MSRYLPGNVVGMFQSFVSQRQRHPLQSQEHVHHKLFHHPQMYMKTSRPYAMK